MTERSLRALNKGLGILDRTEGISPAQRETIVGCATAAVRAFIDRDSEDFDEVFVERDVDIPGLMAGRVDLAGRVSASPRAGHLREYAGRLVVIDWKTTSGALDHRWKQRYAMSWQWRLYAAATGAGLFIYRGISTRYSLELGSYEVREFGIEVPEWNTEYALNELRLAHAQIEGYGSAPRWPRALEPSACYAFGSPCPFIEYCISGLDGPEGSTYPGGPLSYSRLSLLHLCPDRLRMTKAVEGADTTESDERYVGQVIHEVLSETYREYFNPQE